MKRYALLAPLLIAACGDGAISNDPILAACITASKCIGGLPASNCTSSFAQVRDAAITRGYVSTATIACLAKAGADCRAALRCVGNGRTPVPCSDNSTSCNGTLYQACSGDVSPAAGVKGVLVFDCAQLGLQCVDTGTNADCGYGTCAGSMPTCTDADGAGGGDFVQSCTDGILHRYNCAHVGASCTVSGPLGAHCRGNGPTCSAASITNATLRCEGSVLVSCVDGQEGRYDCANLGLGCWAIGSQFDCAAGNECVPAHFQETCAGSRLTVCDQGKRVTVDCASGGFTTCDLNAGTCR